MSREERMPGQPVPWWKVGSMWLVLGGPAVVVVASFVTLYLAASRPDPVYGDIAQPRAADLRTAPDGNGAHLAPAIQARNHAATGVAPSPAMSSSQARP